MLLTQSRLVEALNKIIEDNGELTVSEIRDDRR